MNSFKTKEELEKQISKLKKSEERRCKRRERIFEENNISDSSRVILKDVENRLMEKFKSGTKQGKEKNWRIVSSFKFPYDLLFQSAEPLIHQVYHKQVSLVKELFSLYILIRYQNVKQYAFVGTWYWKELVTCRFNVYQMESYQNCQKARERPYRCKRLESTSNLSCLLKMKTWRH